MPIGLEEVTDALVALPETVGYLGSLNAAYEAMAKRTLRRMLPPTSRMLPPTSPTKALAAEQQQRPSSSLTLIITHTTSNEGTERIGFGSFDSSLAVDGGARRLFFVFGESTTHRRYCNARRCVWIAPCAHRQPFRVPSDDDRRRGR